MLVQCLHDGRLSKEHRGFYSTSEASIATDFEGISGFGGEWHH